MDLEENGRSIGHFQSYMHTKHTTHLLEIYNGLGGKGERHWSLLVINAHTKHNSPPEIDNGLGGKGKGHSSLPVIHVHSNHTTHPLEIDNGLGGKGERHWSLLVTHAHPNTTHHLKLIGWKGGEALVTSCQTCTHNTQLTN